MSVWQLIKGDIEAWRRHGFGDATQPLTLREALLMIWRFIGLRATIFYRLSHAAYRRRIHLLPNLLWHRGILRYGMDIMPTAEIGPGLYIAHPVGVVIGARRIGRNLSITTHVTMGLRVDGAAPPTIGDDVTIGAGAHVLGDIKIGDEVTIGTNAVVLGDVPAGATVMAVPARVVQANVFVPARVTAAIPSATADQCAS